MSGSTRPERSRQYGWTEPDHVSMTKDGKGSLSVKDDQLKYRRGAGKGYKGYRTSVQVVSQEEWSLTLPYVFEWAKGLDDDHRVVPPS